MICPRLSWFYAVDRASLLIILHPWVKPYKFGDNRVTKFTGVDDGAETLSPTAHGASVPSLGLSNKAVFEADVRGGADKKAREEERHVKDIYPDHYFTPEDYSRPPTEEALAQNTLWPELQKLYGHGYEIFTLG